MTIPDWQFSLLRALSAWRRIHETASDTRQWVIRRRRQGWWDIQNRRRVLRRRSEVRGVRARPKRAMTTERYIIRGGVEGRERLRLLSDVMGPSTRALLAEVGIPVGSACLDVGCGGGDVAFELARAAGPSGRAVGIDFDEIKLDIARREAHRLGLTNVVFEVQDVTEWEPDALFDVVYARFLLTHLAVPRALVSALRRHTRVGGVAIIEDIEIGRASCRERV